MVQVEAVLAMFAATVVLAFLAPRLHVPYPVLLVLGGVAVALIPGLPEIRIDPRVVLFVFLPPLLYSASIKMRVEELKANARDITLLAVGLVFVTTGAVAAVARAVVPSLSWTVALVLGAVVSPPDPVAAIAVANRLGLPKRARLLLESEGVFNDATALVLYRVGVAAVVGTVSAEGVVLQFVLAVGLAVVVGLTVGWIGSRVLGHIADPPVENTVTLLIPYAAYLVAELSHASGVLAVLVAGIYLARRMPYVTTSRARLQGQGLWDMIVFILEGLAFLLIGIQLRQVLTGRHGLAMGVLAGAAGAVVIIVVVVRLVWVGAIAAVVRRRGEQDRWSFGAAVFIGWAGMRGLVTMAAVLGLPLATESGRPFPQRQLLLVVAFAVIVATLLLQGLSLPLVADRLGLVSHDDDKREELRARAAAANAALEWLDTSPTASALGPDQIAYLRHRYLARLDDIERFSSLHEETTERSGIVDARRELLDVERRELERLRNQEGLSRRSYDAARRAIDADEARLDRVT